MADEKQKSTTKNIKTPRFTASYLTIVKPRAAEPGKEPEYSVAMLWPRTADLKAIKAEIDRVAFEKFGKEGVEKIRAGKWKGYLRDGNDKAEGEKHAEYKDKLFLNAKAKTRPGVVGVDGFPIDPGEVYSGCDFHASLRFYAYDQKGNKGVGCGLQALLLVHKGTRLDGRADATEEFSDFTPDVRESDASDISDMV
jgi:hypothetical protein